MNYRIGIGYDIHRLVDGRKLVLGGIEIPYIKGLLGHSDGDVLLHAISDALLGAIGAGDIGGHFPDTDPKYLNADSALILKEVKGMAKNKGFKLANVDTIIIAQEPMLSAFKLKIKSMIAQILEIEEESVNVKAKTNEGLGEIGRKEAVAAYAMVSLIREG